MQESRSGRSDAYRRCGLPRDALGRRRAGKIRDNLCGSRFAYGATTVVDTALRQSEFAPARAAFDIEFVQSDLLLLGSKPGKIHTGKLAGAIGMSEEDLAGVFKCLHTRVDGQAEQGADFSFIESRVAQTFVLLDDAALRIQNERGGQRGDAAILETYFRRGHRHGEVRLRFADSLV